MPETQTRARSDTPCVSTGSAKSVISLSRVCAAVALAVGTTRGGGYRGGGWGTWGTGCGVVVPGTGYCTTTPPVYPPLYPALYPALPPLPQG